MKHFGYDRFPVIGQDRGGRVTHRLLLDHPEKVSHAAVLDIVPTRYLYTHFTIEFAQAYPHWFNYLRPAPGAGERAQGHQRRRARARHHRRAEGIPALDDRHGHHPRDVRGLPRQRVDRSEVGRGRREEEDHRVRCGCCGPRRVPMGRLYDVLGIWKSTARKVTGRRCPGGTISRRTSPTWCSRRFRPAEALRALARKTASAAGRSPWSHLASWLSCAGLLGGARVHGAQRRAAHRASAAAACPAAAVDDVPDASGRRRVQAGQLPALQDEPGPVRLDASWMCPVHAVVIEQQPGACRLCGRALVPVVVSLTWTCRGEVNAEFLEPGVCRDGSPRIGKRTLRPHGNHNPQHGGQFFMAPDTWHHLEGTLPRQRLFRLHLYDDYARPLAAADSRPERARRYAPALRRRDSHDDRRGGVHAEPVEGRPFARSHHRWFRAAGGDERQGALQARRAGVPFRFHVPPR